jgi:hypothetical protein
MRAAVACSMTRAVVTFHRDLASQHVIVEASVPQPGPSTGRSIRLYFWSKVRDHDISCPWWTACTPSRGPSQASLGASIILT